MMISPDEAPRDYFIADLLSITGGSRAEKQIANPEQQIWSAPAATALWILTR